MTNQIKTRDQTLLNYLRKTTLHPQKTQLSSFIKKKKEYEVPSLAVHNGSNHKNVKKQMESKKDKCFAPVRQRGKNMSMNRVLYHSLQQVTMANQHHQNTQKNEYEKKELQKSIGGQRQVVSSMDSHKDLQQMTKSKRKLYQVTFKNKPKKQKLRSNLAYLKVNGMCDAFSKNTSVNFSSQDQFQEYLQKLTQSDPDQKQNCSVKKANQNPQEIRQLQALAGRSISGSVITDKKCSIVPAMRPNKGTLRQRKSLDRSQPESTLTTLHNYVKNKKAAKSKEKLLVVQCKKQELLEHHIVPRTKLEKIHRSILIYPPKESIQNFESQKCTKASSSPPKANLKLLPRPTEIKKIPYYILSTFEKSVYEQKIASFRQFLFMLNFAHKVFDPLLIVDATPLTKMQKTGINRFMYFVGAGNNAMLVRSVMARRPWWNQTKNMGEADFVWTQVKVETCFQKQQQAIRQHEDALLEEKEEKQEENVKGCFEKKGVQAVLQLVRRKQKNNISLEHLVSADKAKKEPGEIPKEKMDKTLEPKGVAFKAPFHCVDQQKILDQKDAELYNSIFKKVSLSDIEDFEQRLKHLPKDFLLRKSQYQAKMHNHLEFNHSLGNKKALLHHLQLYYKLSNLPSDRAFPATFHIKHGQSDPVFKSFLRQYRKIYKEQPHMKNIWILKPGENSNRGNGIVVIKDLKQIKKKINNNKQKHNNGEHRTFILQKYIERPLLFKGRKFDLRHYMVVTGLHGRLRGYFHGEGYVRTSSQEFTIDNIKDPVVHLTNDAIQKNADDYGCYQEGNKVSYNQLQKYFAKMLPERQFSMKTIYKKMRQLAKDALMATYISLDPNRRLHNFQIFGLDFMIDEQLHVYLIQVNTNPCLELSSGLLKRVIPSMLQQSFRLALDPIFPPSSHYSNNTRHLAPDCQMDKLQFQLIFDEERQGRGLRKLYRENEGDYRAMMEELTMTELDKDDVFQDEGEEIELANLI